ncbi:condensin complex subunit 3-like protein [Dinothrombium tinctorium]|uniref:Condensin complex subunit 3-like protein n=1 Tax=Dinothrombium tinctorium TaxID=1965070 RepID=A0A443QFV9_9ACAR|nr:condensin complex subunit 3-like protein [Dinothrombium tinctorium]
MKSVRKQSDTTMDNVMRAMRDLFQSAQTVSKTDKCVQSLRKLYADNEEHFCEPFFRFVRKTLQSPDKSPFTKRSIEFIIKFLAQIGKDDSKNAENDECERRVDESTCDDIGFEMFGSESFETVTKISQTQALVDKLVTEVILPYSRAALANIRINTCLLVSKLFAEIDDVDNNVYEELKKTLGDLIADKNPSVRFVAASALYRFQEVDNPNCIATSAYRFHLQYDVVHDVRLAVLNALEPSKTTLTDFISRTRDVKDIIRKTAFLKIAQRIHVKSFTIEQRLNLLKNGLNDRSKHVRKVVETKLVDSWLQAYNNDIIELLTSLDIQSDPPTIEKLLDVIFMQKLQQVTKDLRSALHVYVEEFKEQMLDSRKLLTKSPLTVERSFLWKCLVTFCKNNEDLIAEKTKTTSEEEDNDVIEEIDEMLADIDVSPTENAYTSAANAETEPRDDNQNHNNPKRAKTLKEPIFLVDEIVPQLPHICNYLNKFTSKIDRNDYSIEELMDFEFMYNQLMAILLVYEIEDEAQRRELKKMCNNMLFAETLSVKFQDYITPIMKCLATNVFPDSMALLEFTAEATSGVYNSLAGNEEITKTTQISASQLREYEVRHAKLTVDINEKREELDEAIKGQNYIEAQQIKETLDVLNKEKNELKSLLLEVSCQPSSQGQSQRAMTVNLRDHPKELLKCLQIFGGCLEFGNFTEINDIIQTHIINITEPGILSDEPRIRCLGIKVTGLCCLISPELCQRNFTLLHQILMHDSEKSQAMALKVILDFLCQHGLSVLTNNMSDKVQPYIGKQSISSTSDRRESSDSSEILENPLEEASIGSNEKTLIQTEKDDEEVMKLLMKMLCEQLDSSSNEISHIAAQGVAKLLLLGRLYSPNLLSQLIIKWYRSDVYPETKHFLGVFIPIYAFSDVKYSPVNSTQLSGQTAVEECFMETIETVYKHKYVAQNMNHSRFSQETVFETDIATIDLENMIHFFVELMSDEIHPRIAVIVCQKMMDILQLNSSAAFKAQSEMLVKFLPKVLSLLTLSVASKPQLRDLRVLIRNIKTNIENRITKCPQIVLKRLDKFASKIEMCLSQFSSQDASFTEQQSTPVKSNEQLFDELNKSLNQSKTMDEITEEYEETEASRTKSHEQTEEDDEENTSIDSDDDNDSESDDNDNDETIINESFL